VKPIELGKVAKHLMPKHVYEAWKAEVNRCVTIAVTVDVTVTWLRVWLTLHDETPHEA
jgi:hypothetical protein